MQILTQEGELIGQFGEQKRKPLSYEEIPSQFIKALMAAEDDGFFEHRGVDIKGLLRAVSELILTGKKGSGGSTITMQVARNYFLSLEKTFLRKFNEILLAIEIERRLSKREIFGLYFNRVFLGHRAYGFEAASEVYYGKSISNLSLAQHAMLAGIPKAPSRNNPISGPSSAKERRNWILKRMLSLKYIKETEYLTASKSTVTARFHGSTVKFSAEYSAEMARREMLRLFGSGAYTDGYRVYTTIQGRLQRVAQSEVVDGLLRYDKRHGYRGPERQFPVAENDRESQLEIWLSELQRAPKVDELIPAIIKETQEQTASFILSDGSEHQLDWEDGLKQARPYISENQVGPYPKAAANILSIGDLVRVKHEENGRWQLSQIPRVQAALVALQPNTGAILSVVGGMGFSLSKFNRATQAFRQPGSNFKPFLYSAALEHGFTAASVINDAPIVLEDTALEETWRPENDGGKFYGPTRLRWALTKSRNIVSIRLLQKLGIGNLINYVENLGIQTRDFPRDLSLALGSQTMSPMQIATAYAVLANGGFSVKPYLIAKVEKLDGEIVYQNNPAIACHLCAEEKDDYQELSMEEILLENTAKKEEKVLAPRVMDARVNFIIDSILKDVIKLGTGRRALKLERDDIAGKTGTSNGPMDAWFSGYNSEIVTSTWVGFDNFTSLGRREFGGTAALPIWIEFMRQAMEDMPEKNRVTPTGVVLTRIDPITGLASKASNEKAIFEYFRIENSPTRNSLGSENTLESQGTEELIKELF
ncbi:MAG: PBP1A family penicillin-binding protein [Halieaceae bacterium]|nr:PBP1A family penicillin-binding protein [Halieaceae bacterium]